MTMCKHCKTSGPGTCDGLFADPATASNHRCEFNQSYIDIDDNVATPWLSRKDWLVTTEKGGVRKVFLILPILLEEKYDEAAIMHFSNDDSNGMRWAISVIKSYESQAAVFLRRTESGAIALATSGGSPLANYCYGLLRAEWRRLQAKRARRRYRSKAIL